MLLLIAKFAYINAKIASTGHIPIQLNCFFYFQAFYKKDINLWSKSKVINKLAGELKKVTAICKENF